MISYSNKKIFYIDSRKRISGTDSDFTYYLDLGKEQFDYACVLQANIPKSYFLVETGYNTFYLKENSTTVPIILPAGNYTRSSLKAQIQTLLNSESPNSWTYGVSVPSATSGPDNGKYTFSVSGNSSQPSFIFNTVLYEQLGFDANTQNDFVAGVLISTNVIKLQLEDSVYIHSDLVTNKTDNILQEVFAIDSPDYGNIVYVCPSVEAYSKKISNSNSNSYKFYLSDENGQPIDLNGLNIVFTLLLFREDNTFSLIKDFLKLNIMQQR